MKTVSCDICGNVPARLVRPIAHRRIVRCRRCGLAFLAPKPTPEEIERFYGNDYYESRDPLRHGYENYDALSASIAHMATHKLKIVRSRVRGGRLLDVGAAYGHFVKEAARAGFDAQGVELSEHAARIARERTGAAVRSGEISQLDASRRPFDVITMWDVLEHAFDARGTLESACSALRTGGFIFLTVPNAASFIARVMGRHWFGFQKLEHTYYFTARTIKMLLRSTGFVEARCHAATWSCSLAYIVRRLGHYNAALASSALAFVELLGINDSTIDFRWIDMLVVARRGRGRCGSAAAQSKGEPQ